MNEQTTTTHRWIDIHTHLDKLDITTPEALQLSKTNGVERMITIGTEEADHKTVLSLAENFGPMVFCTLGFHPHDAGGASPEGMAFLKANLHNKRVVAVGEIGLDYYYENAAREVQQQIFREQMEIAAEFKLPVEIHTRDAEDDTAQILQEFKGRVRGVLHCFTSSWGLAEKALDCGYDISISGVVTFKNADDLRATVKRVPLDRLHVETDAPFLTPMPFRGKKNAPHFIVNTAKVVADLKGVSLETLSETTNRTAERLFTKLLS
jgi:TatD DNase family protein